MSGVVFYQFQPKADESEFESGTSDWKDLYGDIKEELPPGMSEPLGKNTHMMCFFYYNHIGEIVTLS